MYYTPVTVSRFPDPQWVILPDAVLCFATIGDRAWDCSFETPNWFAWATSQPQVLQSDAEFSFLPPEVAGPDALDNIWLFGRLPGWKKYVCLGQIDHCSQAGYEGNVCGAVFEFSPPIPDELWPLFRGTSVNASVDDGLEKALDSLSSESSFKDKFAVLQRVVLSWYGPIVGDDSYLVDEIGDKTHATGTQRVVFMGRST